MSITTQWHWLVDTTDNSTKTGRQTDRWASWTGASKRITTIKSRLMLGGKKCHENNWQPTQSECEHPANARERRASMRTRTARWYATKQFSVVALGRRKDFIFCCAIILSNRWVLPQCNFMVSWIPGELDFAPLFESVCQYQLHNRSL